MRKWICFESDTFSPSKTVKVFIGDFATIQTGSTIAEFDIYELKEMCETILETIKIQDNEEGES